MSYQDLSTAQQDVLDSLLAITSSETELDRSRDLQVLRDVGWNIQAALEVIFSAQQAPQQPMASSSSDPYEVPPSPPPPAAPASHQFSLDDSNQSLPSYSGPTRLGPAGMRFPRGVRGVTRVGVGIGFTLWHILYFPIRILGLLLGGGFVWIARLLPASFIQLLPPAIRPNLIRSDATSSSPTSSTPTFSRNPSLGFVQALEHMTGLISPSSLPSATPMEELGLTQMLPEFYIGTYKSAIEKAKSEGRILMVMICSSEHLGDENWKKTVLPDPTLQESLKRHDVILWAADIKEKETVQVARLLPPMTYPSISFISLLTPPSRVGQNGGATMPLSEAKLAVLSRLEGVSVDAAEIVMTIEQSIVPRTAAVLDRVRREKRLREEERRLREEQDRAFQESSAKDLARILATRKAQSDAQTAAQTAAVARQAEIEALRAQSIIKEEHERVRLEYLRFARKNLLPAEPREGTIITLRIPPGRIPVRRVFPSDTPLEVLYLWADTLSIPSDLPTANDPTDPPTSTKNILYNHQFSFRLVTTYPRMVVASSGQSVDESEELKKGGGVLIVERIEQIGKSDGEDQADDDSEDDEDDEGAENGQSGASS